MRLGKEVLVDLEQALRTAASELKDFGSRGGKLFPSDLGVPHGDGGCKRAFWYQYRDEPTRPMDEDRKLKMLVGDALEDMVIDMLTRTLPLQGWRVIGTQTYAPVPGTTGGKIDILIQHIESGTRVVIDVKATSSKSKNFLPKKGHKLQVQGYLKGLDVDEGFLLYVFYDMDEEPMSFTVYRDDNAVVSATNDLNALVEGPEPGPAEKSWQRKYCNLEVCRCR